MTIPTEVITRLEKRASEIERHVKTCWGSDEEARKWWPDAIQHAADIRVVLEAPKPPAPGEWIVHDGKTQPVADDVWIDLEFDEGTLVTETLAQWWEWDHTDSDPQIIKYRLA